MQHSKVKAVDTYFTHANYWAPLTDDNNNDDDDNIQKEQSKFALTTPQEHHTTVEAFDKNAFCRWLHQRCNIKLASKTEEMGMVLDSGATSHFVRLAENLPTTGSSYMTVIYQTENQSKLHIPCTYLLSAYIRGRDTCMSHPTLKPIR
jgi:hypothetical protein